MTHTAQMSLDHANQRCDGQPGCCRWYEYGEAEHTVFSTVSHSKHQYLDLQLGPYRSRYPAGKLHQLVRTKTTELFYKTQFHQAQK